MNAEWSRERGSTACYANLGVKKRQQQQKRPWWMLSGLERGTPLHAMHTWLSTSSVPQARIVAGLHL